VRLAGGGAVSPPTRNLTAGQARTIGGHVDTQTAEVLVLTWYQREVVPNGGSLTFVQLGNLALDIVAATELGGGAVTPPVAAKKRRSTSPAPTVERKVRGANGREVGLCAEPGCGKVRKGRSSLCPEHLAARGGPAKPKEGPTRNQWRGKRARADRAESKAEQAAPPDPDKHGNVELKTDNPTRAESVHDGKRKTNCPAYNACLSRAIKLGWPALNCALCLGTKMYTEPKPISMPRAS